jgi:hypothetical protein
MRWEALFADLQGQWDAAQRADDDARIADLAELEMGRATVADRIRARRDATISFRLVDGSEVAGVLLDAAEHWALVRCAERRCVVPLSAVVAAWPLGPVAPAPGVVERRLGVTHVLRAIAREGAVVRLRALRTEARGRIVRVGADHLDLVAEGVDGPGALVTVVLGALLAVESTS